MKKLVAVLLSCLMVMGMLAACGSSAPAETKAPETTAAAAPETTAAAAETEAAEAGFTTIEAGKLIMSTNAAFPPYEMVADDGSFEGIDVEVAGAIAAKLGLELVVDDMDFSALTSGCLATDSTSDF